MPGVQITSNHGNCIFSWQRNGQSEVQSVTLGLYNAGGTLDWQDVCDDIYAAFINSNSLGAANFMHTDWRSLGVKIYYREEDLNPLRAVEHFAPVSGTYAPANYQSPPISTCVIARKRCAVLGKQYRGRWYLPSCHSPNSAIDAGGQLDPTYVAQYQTAVADLFTGVLATGVFPVLLHAQPKTGGIPVATDITGCFVQGRIGTQRRRLS